jgi:cell wall integrity and stress response component
MLPYPQACATIHAQGIHRVPSSPLVDLPLTLVDICGNVSSDLFSYIQIGQGSGVISQSAATSTSSIVDGFILPTSTQAHSIATVTVNRGTTVVVTSFIPSEPSITLSSVSPTSSLGNGTNPVHQPDNSQPTPVTRSDSFWDSTGKVASVFVAVGVVVALLALGLIWMCRKRRRRQDEEKSEVVTGTQSIARQISGSQPVSRSTSLLQLLGKTRDRSPQEEIVSPTSVGSRRLSRSPTDLVIPVVDQRLDPQSMMIRFDDNDSRTSFRDEEDYSRRVWRVTNASDSDSVRSS